MQKREYCCNISQLQNEKRVAYISDCLKTPTFTTRIVKGKKYRKESAFAVGSHTTSMPHSFRMSMVTDAKSADILKLLNDWTH